MEAASRHDLKSLIGRRVRRGLPSNVPANDEPESASCEVHKIIASRLSIGDPRLANALTNVADAQLVEVQARQLGALPTALLIGVETYIALLSGDIDERSSAMTLFIRLQFEISSSARTGAITPDVERHLRDRVRRANDANL